MAISFQRSSNIPVLYFYFVRHVVLTEPSERVSEDEGHSSGFEEEESAALQGQSRSSPLALTRLLSRSRGSLLVSALLLFFV
jgi:hypothetical protein